MTEYDEYKGYTAVADDGRIRKRYHALYICIVHVVLVLCAAKHSSKQEARYFQQIQC